ncbi:MAG: hypothetical protein Q7J59_02690 [Elusimicrobiota bacterium]|nr:hypothetical protein [Elusimicrobiota bacterium]
MENPGKEFREKNLPELLEVARGIKEPEYLCAGLISIAKIYAHFGNKKELLSTLREIMGIISFMALGKEKAIALADTGILYAKSENMTVAGELIAESVALGKKLQKDTKNKLYIMSAIHSSCVNEIKNTDANDGLTDFLLYHALKTANLITCPFYGILAMLKTAEIYLMLKQQNNAVLFLERAEKTIYEEKTKCLSAHTVAMMLPLLVQTEQNRKANYLLKCELEKLRTESIHPVTRTSGLFDLAEGCAEAGMKDEALLTLHEKIDTSDNTSKNCINFSPFGKMTEIYFKLGMREESLAVLNKLLPSIESSKPESLAGNMLTVAWATEQYLKLGEKAAAEKLLDLVEFLPEKAKWSKDKIRLYIDVGNLFVKFKHLYKATEYWKKALARTGKIDDDEQKSACACELSELYISIVDGYEGGKNAQIKNEE